MTETCQSESCVCGAVAAAFVREEIMNFGVEPFVSAHLGRFDRCSTRRLQTTPCKTLSTVLPYMAECASAKFAL